MDDDWIYESEDFDPEGSYIELQLGPDDLLLVYKSICVHLDKWSGGHPEEQERLHYLKNFLYRIVLEYKFNMD